MAKTEDPFVQKAAKFEEMLESPRGFLQKGIKWTLRIVFLPIHLIKNLYPFSVGTDYGHIYEIQNKNGFREAVIFGKQRLVKYSERENKSRSFFKGSKEFNRVATWLLLERTVGYACSDPQHEDEAFFEEVLNGLETQGSVENASKVFCSMARLTWALGKREEPWFWVGKAILTDNKNAEAHYLKGWFAALLEKGNPVESLFEAVKQEPDLLRNMRNDEALLRFPDFMAAVEARAKQTGIIVV